MRLVSDFDGVWTHPGEEARAQGDVLDAALEALVPHDSRAATRAWIARAREAVRAEPMRYGWAPGGRISAFADEDPFAPHSALLHYLHVHAVEDPIARALCDAVLASAQGSLEAFGGWAHGEGVKRVVAARGPATLSESAAAGRRLARAHEVVVVSNSRTAKLVEWIGAAGLETTVHPESRSGAVCLRGDAAKFALDPEARAPLALGDARVETARPRYEAILREERPGAIVGDVFSIDLALPLRLRREEPAWRNVRLFWLVRDYTPAWLRALIATHAPEVEALATGLPGVADALGA